MVHWRNDQETYGASTSNQSIQGLEEKVNTINAWKTQFFFHALPTLNLKDDGTIYFDKEDTIF